MSKSNPNHLPIYMPSEVVTHNTPYDCWISFLGKVFNVTSLILKYANNPCVKPLIAFAGKDVSHWFDERTGELQMHIHPVTGCFVPYCPHGRLPGVPFEAPTVKWKPTHDIWWKSSKLQVGLLTKKARPLRIINMLTATEVVIDVCCEDTIERIAERHKMFNTEPESYIWKYFDQILDMDKTLEENGILDERDYFVELGLPKSFYIPPVFIYYIDDMKHVDELSD